jgi:hypothetical protein
MVFFNILQGLRIKGWWWTETKQKACVLCVLTAFPLKGNSREKMGSWSKPVLATGSSEP